MSPNILANSGTAIKSIAEELLARLASANAGATSPASNPIAASLRADTVCPAS